MNEGNIFLLSWDMNGLEAVINITDIEKQSMWETLQDLKPTNRLSSVVNQIMMRARYNSQRHYEVYTVRVDDSITAEDLRAMFEDNPQQAADLIRARGTKLYSDRVDQKSVKIV